jgi:uncharacterized RDD family membrane protein YckC
MSVTVTSTPASSLQGMPAGFATRAAGFLLDLVTIAVLFTVGAAVFERMLSLVLFRQVRLEDHRTLSIIAVVVWAFGYCAYTLAVAGRTLGMALLGLRAVSVDGSDLPTRRAVLRVPVVPASFLLLGFGFALSLIRRDHRALHDLISGSAVVYDWHARAGHLAFLLRGRPDG